MTRVSAAVLACVTASCGPVSERTEISSAVRTNVIKPTQGAPHAAEIAAVAVTETGDVALTTDTLGGWKLWPTLDGTRQPVSIEAPPAIALALTSRGDELVAAAIDRAGAVRVLRLGRDGVVHARAQVAGDIAARELAVVGGDVLVRRADETIERVDADGVVRGRLAAMAGERLGAIASRGGGVLVAIRGAEDTRTVRWLDLGDTLRWSPPIELPQTIDPEVLALAPSRTRIASLHGGGALEQVVIFELDHETASSFAMPSLFAGPDVPIGFVDDHELGVGASWWVQGDSDYDLKDAPPPAKNAIVLGAFGDGVGVSPHGAGLRIATPDHTQFLGWRELAQQAAQPFGDGYTYGADAGRFLWVDGKLENVRGFDLGAIPGPVPYSATAIGEHELAYQARADAQVQVAVVDTREPTHSIVLGTFAYVPQLTFEPTLHELAFNVPGKIERYHIDTDPLRATALPSLAFDGVAYSIHLVDPEQADGAVAIVYGAEGDADAVLHVFRAKAGKIRHERSAVDNASFTTDLAGNLYDHSEVEQFVRRGKRVVAHFPVPGAGSPNHAGTALAVVTSRDVKLVDLHGDVKWHHDLWNVYFALFSRDDKTVVVRTQTGLVAYDVATGEAIRRVCGWEFGLHDSLTEGTYGAPTVCEDDGQ